MNQGKVHDALDEHEGQLYASMHACRKQYLRQQLSKRKRDADPMSEVSKLQATQRASLSVCSNVCAGRNKPQQWLISEHLHVSTMHVKSGWQVDKLTMQVPSVGILTSGTGYFFYKCHRGSQPRITRSEYMPVGLCKDIETQKQSQRSWGRWYIFSLTRRGPLQAIGPSR